MEILIYNLSCGRKCNLGESLSRLLGQKVRPSSKIISAKKAVPVVPVVEHLPHKCKALSSNPSTDPLSKK
jgi:hypothetical protein